jgi:hypothetical protein
MRVNRRVEEAAQECKLSLTFLLSAEVLFRTVHNVLYLMIVNMPSEEEMAAARDMFKE